ncbi:MAG: hypothetical protein ACRD3V_01530 [Vicinamibacteria bacterium]
MAGVLVDCGGGDGEPRADDDPPASAADVGGDEDASDTSSCDLLTDAEVGEATGTTIASHEESGLHGCTWRAQDGMQLILDVYSGSSATCHAQKVLGTGREEVVSGLGDSALWKTSGSLVVCTPRAVIRFNLNDSNRTVPEDKEGLIPLASSVLDRM